MYKNQPYNTNYMSIVMKAIITSAVCSSLLLVAGCNTSEPTPTATPSIQKTALASGIDKANMDLTVRPQDNFYRYVNGGWLKRNEIPGDKTTIGSFYDLRDDADKNVKAIIEESVVAMQDWASQMSVSPTIQKLKTALDQIRKEEMAKYMKGLSEEEAVKVNKITESMMQKVMKIPVLQLKAACKRGEADELIDVLNDLFDLEKVETSVKA